MAIWAPLVLPNHPGAMTPGALRVLPLEWPAILLVLAVCRGRAVKPVRICVTMFLSLICLVKLADLASNAAYLRMFNPVFDLHLIPASWHMLSGAVGTVRAIAVIGAALIAAGLAVATWWWATGRTSGLAPGGWAPVAALAVIAIGTDLFKPAGIDPPGVAFSARLAGEHVRHAAAARGDLRRFHCAADADPYSLAPSGAMLDRLDGRDVYLIFVESYGRAALDRPLYAATIQGTLNTVATRLDAHGLAQRSGWLTSPVIGGQSWLAHASTLSGLWIDTNIRYRALLESERRTLLHFASDAGWNTVAVMPAITLNWPDSRFFGYGEVLDAAALDYRGLAFNWVTMPDQFTLASFERAVLGGTEREPVFAEIALISSHAPWTPVPEAVPWEAVGDGRIFSQFAVLGDPPIVIWRDPDRIREQYRLALSYVLDVVGSFAARRSHHKPLIIVLGDHQPAPLVSGDGGNRDVPVHVIGRAEDVEAFSDPGWRAGMVPAADAPVWRMDAFRDRFLAAFTTTGNAQEIFKPSAPFTGAGAVLGSCS